MRTFTYTKVPDQLISNSSELVKDMLVLFQNDSLKSPTFKEKYKAVVELLETTNKAASFLAIARKKLALELANQL